MQSILDYRIDVLLLAGFGVIAVISAEIIFRRRQIMARRRLRHWGAIAAIVLAAGALAEWVDFAERGRLINMVSGFAPTYADDLTRMGHANVHAGTPSDDPQYLTMIEAQRRWLQLNPAVNDIYTFRIGSDRVARLIVDSETDYDHSGAIDDEREQRTAIGEPFDSYLENIDVLIAGRSTAFDDRIVTDRWGTWVSGYAPMYAADGRLEAILGIDLDAHAWITAILRARLIPLGAAAIVLVLVTGSILVVQLVRAEMAKRTLAERERDRLNRILLDATRQAGMAEVATNVLHNVGNVLNSVNLSAHVTIDHIRSSKVPNLGRAVAMLNEHAGDLPQFLVADEKGKVLPRYLATLAQTLQAEQEGLLAEMRTLSSGIDHIKEIVRQQQTMACRSTMLERIRPQALVDDAVSLNLMSIERHQIDIVRDYANDLPAAMLDRHKVIQVLVNLIGNARDALKMRQGEGPRRLTLSLRVDGQSLVIAVADTGVGIAADHLDRIFNHGFTTKPDGHGFGLHYAANAVTEMGGKMHVHSDGPGTGATFTVELPIQGVRPDAAPLVGATPLTGAKGGAA